MLSVSVILVLLNDAQSTGWNILIITVSVKKLGHLAISSTSEVVTIDTVEISVSQSIKNLKHDSYVGNPIHRRRESL